MGRPRTFDPDRAIDKAMGVFWRRGYRGTSIQDLVDATGLKRGSLYAAFGSKAGLFAAVMDRYMATTNVRRILDEGDDRPVRDVIADVFAALVEAGAGDRTRRGCLLTNTAVELTPHDRTVAARIDDNLRALEDTLCRRLAAAQARGELPAGRRPRALARFLVSSMQGLRVMSKVRPERRVLQDIAEGALACLE